MASKRKRAARMLRWRRYQQRCDALTGEQWRTRVRIQHPMRTTPGFFRAEGWDTRGVHRQTLGHGG